MSAPPYLLRCYMYNLSIGSYPLKTVFQMESFHWFLPTPLPAELGPFVSSALPRFSSRVFNKHFLQENIYPQHKGLV